MRAFFSHRVGVVQLLQIVFKQLLFGLAQFCFCACAVVPKVDLELIEQMIDNQALEVSDLSELVHFMVSRLRDLEAPVENAATDVWLEQMASELATLPTTKQWSVLLPRAFVYISDNC